MSKEEIKAGIEARIKGVAGYPMWRIGLTHDPRERKAYWKDIENENVGCWTLWDANSLSDAQEIERHFIHDKGMKGGVGGDMSHSSATYVYIF